MGLTNAERSSVMGQYRWLHWSRFRPTHIRLARYTMQVPRQIFMLNSRALRAFQAVADHVGQLDRGIRLRLTHPRRNPDPPRAFSFTHAHDILI
jgi:prephenate dehydrogenase